VKKIPLSIAGAVFIAGSTAAFAAELPTYDVNGFPISQVQVQLLGAANVRERSAASTVMASPQRPTVLTPGPKPNTATAAPITIGTSR
jgi:hypothetical protein